MRSGPLEGRKLVGAAIKEKRAGRVEFGAYYFSLSLRFPTASLRSVFTDNGAPPPPQAAERREGDRDES